MKVYFLNDYWPCHCVVEFTFISNEEWSNSTNIILWMKDESRLLWVWMVSWIQPAFMNSMLAQFFPQWRFSLFYDCVLWLWFSDCVIKTYFNKEKTVPIFFICSSHCRKIKIAFTQSVMFFALTSVTFSPPLFSFSFTHTFWIIFLVIFLRIWNNRNEHESMVFWADSKYLCARKKFEVSSI